jgi:hypothetical protein
VSLMKRQILPCRIMTCGLTMMKIAMDRLTRRKIKEIIQDRLSINVANAMVMKTLVLRIGIESASTIMRPRKGRGSKLEWKIVGFFFGIVLY